MKIFIAVNRKKILMIPNDLKKGIILMLIGVLVVPWLDGFAKLLTQTLPLLQVVWGRFVMQFIITLPLALHRHGRRVFHIRQWKLQVVRGTMLLLASIFFSQL